MLHKDRKITQLPLQHHSKNHSKSRYVPAYHHVSAVVFQSAQAQKKNETLQGRKHGYFYLVAVPVPGTLKRGQYGDGSEMSPRRFQQDGTASNYGDERVGTIRP